MNVLKEKSWLPALLIGLPFLGFSLFEFEHALATAVFTATVLLWFTEALPLAVTGLLVPVMAILSGTLSPEKAFGAFGNQILFLFIGSFLLARAMEKHGLDVRVSYLILSSNVGSRSLSSLVALVGIVAWVFSMWISNTATVAMLVPMCLGISSTLKDSFSDETELKRFNARLLLTLAFSASVGGMATPVGSPPNLLAIEFLAREGIQISFLSWMLLAIPLSLCMLFVVLTILRFLFNTREVALTEVRLVFKERLSALGPLSRGERMTLLCFILAVLLWVLPDLLTQMGGFDFLVPIKARLPMGLVAILAASLLFMLAVSAENPREKVLEWKDAAEIDWGTILLFGGGICLGTLIGDSGLASKLSGFLIPDGSTEPLLPFATLLLLGVLLSEFGSNTASASILIPILLGSDLGAQHLSLTLIVCGVAFAASFGFMLPVSTPPNAIVFGSGKLNLYDMIRAGIFFDILGVLLIFVYIGLFLPLLL